MISLVSMIIRFVIIPIVTQIIIDVIISILTIKLHSPLTHSILFLTQNNFLNTNDREVNLLIKLDAGDSSSTRIDADLSVSGQVIFTIFRIICIRAFQTRDGGTTVFSRMLFFSMDLFVLSVFFY